MYCLLIKTHILHYTILFGLRIQVLVFDPRNSQIVNACWKFLNQELVAFSPYRSRMCTIGSHGRGTQPVLHNRTRSREKISGRLWVKITLMIALMMSPMAPCQGGTWWMSDGSGRNRSLHPALESERSNFALPLSIPIIESWVHNVIHGDSL
jgi:hypothetical protein